MQMPEYRREHADFVDQVLSYRTKKEAQLLRIGAASGRNKRRGLIWSFLTDQDLKLLYLLRSVQHKGKLQEYPPDRLRAVSHELSATTYVSEPVTPINLPTRPPNRRRRTYDFGPRRHAMQSMVADVIKKLFPIPSGRHFTIIGGVRAALETVQEHAQEGFIYAVERDIEQFYPSVNLEGLARLLQPLPGSVVMNVLAYRPGYRHDQTGHAVAVGDAPLPPRGLLAQGSAASPVAAEVIVADLLRDMPHDVRVMSYADNMLILGRTPDSANAASALLEARANEHPCGPLGLKVPPKISTITAPAGIHFLGNQGYWNEGKIDWEPDYHALNNIMRVVEAPRGLDEVVATIEWLRRWRRGYPCWACGDAEVARYIAQLAARLALSTDNTLSQPYRVGLGLFVRSCRTLRSFSDGFPDLTELLPEVDETDPTRPRRSRFIADVHQRLGGNERV